jgi:cytoskeletal protein CcmA (bactofilin family)
VTESALPDVKLVGRTTAGGGRFGNVRITGEAEIAGDLECRNMTCVGTAQMKGNLRSRALRLTGDCRIEGDLHAARVRGVGEIRVSGGIRGEAVKLTGNIRVARNFEAETIRLRGSLDADGLVSADRMELLVHGPCRAKEIGGGSVAVKRSRAVLWQHWFHAGRHGGLTADLIEGDTLHLEHTRAAVVRGNRITIGPGCQIDRVEFREELRVSRNATVRNRVRL